MQTPTPTRYLTERGAGLMELHGWSHARVDF
jgi:hypothetical protein